MKKILSIFLIISFLTLVGCNKVIPTNNETKQNDNNSTVESTIKSELSKANKALENQGKLIIEKESFTEDTFVSLKEMNSKYNIDISRYISSELFCDEEKSGVNIYVSSGKVTVEPYLYGCTILSTATTEEANEEKELIDELLTFGKKIYEEKKYIYFKREDAGYVISLTELDNNFNFDLTNYSEYDVDNSMIIIDADKNNGIEYNEEPVLVHLVKKGN